MASALLCNVLASQEQTVVGCFLGDGMLEDVFQVRWDLAH
jgi:hypothetical protein